MSRLEVGKLPSELLARLLERHRPSDPRVLIGPRVGEDAAVIDMGDRCLVAKTDPITFATDEIGWYAVHVNANDIACCGARPRWFLATVLLPGKSATAAQAEAVVDQIGAACADLGVSLCGGHTEITYDLDRPIVVGQMLGEVGHDDYITTGGARVGDALLLTKGIAVEGTSIVAREARERLAGVLSDSALERAAALLHDPGISVLPEAMAAIDAGGVTALHDPTEGGVATGLHELARAAGVGLEIDEASLPVLPECAEIAHHLGLNPLGLIASGSLLLSVAPDRAAAVRAAIEAIGVDASVIGRVVDAEAGCTLHAADGTVSPLPVFARDEIATLFD